MELLAITLARSRNCLLKIGGYLLLPEFLFEVR
jgi:hypothetical protein